ncbi:unnamed protein product [Blepharisma stoltei]|uniref:Maturase K n=1 Tax=Blepharisma stoltei TaxID=1481888 RepID=A0AAU9JX33_9CILI|nr:unnamed protein product [Blepharisma stoltei]
MLPTYFLNYLIYINVWYVREKQHFRCYFQNTIQSSNYFVVEILSSRVTFITKLLLRLIAMSSNFWYFKSILFAFFPLCNVIMITSLLIESALFGTEQPILNRFLFFYKNHLSMC